MLADMSMVVEVLDPRNRKLVPKAVDLYTLALSTVDDPLLLCRARNPDGAIIQDSDARRIHTELMRESKDVPYQCSAGVCGYCLSEGEK